MPGPKVTAFVWNGPKVQAGLEAKMKARVKLAGQLVRDQVVRNISKSVASHGRSKPGEFPHADTTRLMKSIFWEAVDDGLKANVGTPVDYGLELELGGRSFLRRTVIEMDSQLKQLFTKKLD